MPTTSARAILNGAFGLIGLLAAGETLQAEESTDGFDRLNRMLSGWKLQPLTQPVTARETFALTANKGGPSNPYTIGSGGDFNTTKPIALEGAGLILTSGTPDVEIPRALLTDDAFQAIRVKELTSTLFTCVYYNPTYASNLGTITLWPVPDNADNQLALYRKTYLTSFVSLDASYTCPDGFEEAAEYQLALRLAAPWGRALSADVVMLAREVFGNFKRANVDLSDLAQDPAFTRSRSGGYNIQTGTGG